MNKNGKKLKKCFFSKCLLCLVVSQVSCFLRVCFCMGSFIMVPFNLKLSTFFFEQHINLYCYVLHASDLLTTAPGLEEGMMFAEPVARQPESQSDGSTGKVMTLADIMTLNDDFGDLDFGEEEEPEQTTETKEVTIDTKQLKACVRKQHQECYKDFLQFPTLLNQHFNV